MNDRVIFTVNIGDVISSSSSGYMVERVLGSGTFGEVVECRKLATHEKVAIKLLKKKGNFQEAFREKEMLQKLNEQDPDKFNIVRWTEAFTYKERFCLVFEKLDISLHQLRLQKYQRLNLMKIRPIVKQLATALEFLKSKNITHADLKPANIMMVDHKFQPLRVKVIDFGLALDNQQLRQGATLQSLWYRAPEILLGAPFNEAIDVWSLGCIAAEMFTGMPLFYSGNKYDMMKRILHIVGQPSDALLASGLYTNNYFLDSGDGVETSKYKFIHEARSFIFHPSIDCLDDMEMVNGNDLYRHEDLAEAYDRVCFVDLLKKMLNLDPSERITPSQILQHPFITMSYFSDTFNPSIYVTICQELMKPYQDETPDDKVQASAHCHAPGVGIPAAPSGGKQPSIKIPFICEEDRPALKRKRDADEVNSSPDTGTFKKRQLSERPETETSAQTSTGQPGPLKRKRDEADRHSSSDEEPNRSTQEKPSSAKRSRCSGSMETETSAQMSKGQPGLLKRKRDDADRHSTSDEEPHRSTQEKLSSVKKRRRSMDE